MLGASILTIGIGAQQAAQGLGHSDGTGRQIEAALPQAATLVSPAALGGRFGSAIALSAQGTTAIVGAPLDVPGGTAWIYVRSGATWSRQGPPLSALEAPEACVADGGHESGVCRLGISVALSADGDVALIGAPTAHDGEGTARLFLRTGTSWVAGPTLHPSDGSTTGHFGRSVALSEDGETALVGEPAAGTRHHGAAWIFTRSGNTWSPGIELQGEGEAGSAYFGRSVALSGDGATALVGGPYDDEALGAAWVFARTGAGWEPQGPKLTPEASGGKAAFGLSTALSSDGSTALIGAPNSDGNIGAGYVFTRTDGSWSQQGGALAPAAAFKASHLGITAALSGDGERALFGGTYKGDGAGAVWEFLRGADAWSERAESINPAREASHAHLGAGLALAADGSTALAGAPSLDGETGGVWSLYEIGLPAPTVTAVEPDSGPSTGGTLLTIKGTGFLAGATVSIGQPAVEVEVISETEIGARTPAGEAGAREVIVADDGGFAPSGPAFTYTSPEAEAPVGHQTTGTAGPAARSGVLASLESKFPPPVLGVSGNLDPVSGHIRVKLPGRHVWVSIVGLTQVPFGTIIDATHGKVTITTIGPKGTEQQISFFSGMFKLLQNKRNAEVLAVLVGGSFASCPRAHGRAKQAQAAASRKHVVRKLWASGHGSYTTKGSYAAGAVVGTKWLTADRCDGTLIYVATDEVAVTNLVTHRHVLVRTHHSYLAAAR